MWKGDARVEAVIPNHMEAGLGKTALVLQHVVEVLRGGKETTDQHQNSKQSTIRGASGRVRGVPGHFSLLTPLGGSVIGRG